MECLLFQKKGKMVALLKQKSKIIIERKPRKTYEVKPFFKRAKEPGADLFAGLNQANNIMNFDKTKQDKKKITPTRLDVENVEMKDQKKE